MANIKLSSKTSTTADVTATFYAPNFNPRASHTERTRRWTVRLVRPGDSWGLNNKLILEEGKEPRIEFYDGGVGPTPPSAEKSDRATYGVLASYYSRGAPASPRAAPRPTGRRSAAPSRRRTPSSGR